MTVRALLPGRAPPPPRPRPPHGDSTRGVHPVILRDDGLQAAHHLRIQGLREDLREVPRLVSDGAGSSVGSGARGPRWLGLLVAGRSSARRAARSRRLMASCSCSSSKDPERGLAHAAGCPRARAGCGCRRPACRRRRPDIRGPPSGAAVPGRWAPPRTASDLLTGSCHWYMRAPAAVEKSSRAMQSRRVIVSRRTVPGTGLKL